VAGDRDDFDADLRGLSGRGLSTDLLARLPETPAVLPRDLAFRAAPEAGDRATVAFLGVLPGAFAEDFLRVFLDIRLPFVAFGGSIIRLLRVESRRAQIKSAAG
jgi:hypothetical protein